MLSWNKIYQQIMELTNWLVKKIADENSVNIIFAHFCTLACISVEVSNM